MIVVNRSEERSLRVTSQGELSVDIHMISGKRRTEDKQRRNDEIKRMCEWISGLPFEELDDTSITVREQEYEADDPLSKMLDVAHRVMNGDGSSEADLRNLLYAYYDIDNCKVLLSPGDNAPEPYSVMDLPLMSHPPVAHQPTSPPEPTIVVSVLKQGELDEAAKEAGLSTIIEEENECSLGTVHFQLSSPYHGFISNRGGPLQDACSNESERHYIVIQHTEDEEVSYIEHSERDYCQPGDMVNYLSTSQQPFTDPSLEASVDIERPVFVVYGEFEDIMSEGPVFNHEIIVLPQSH